MAAAVAVAAEPPWPPSCAYDNSHQGSGASPCTPAPGSLSPSLAVVSSATIARTQTQTRMEADLEVVAAAMRGKSEREEEVVRNEEEALRVEVEEVEEH